MSNNVASNIRVFVTFKEDAIFAGEEVEATITFKNVELRRTPVAAPGNRSRIGAPPDSRAPSVTSQAPSRATHSRQTSITTQTPTHTSPRPKQPRPSLGHRQTLSLNIPANSTKRSPTIPSPVTAHPAIAQAKSAAHSRSVSIVSYGSDADGKNRTRGQPQEKTGISSPFKFGRSASVQVTPTRGWFAQRSLGGASDRAPPQPPQNATISSPPSSFRWKQTPMPHQGHARKLSGPGPKSSLGGGSVSASGPNHTPQTSRDSSGRLEQSFRFPNEPPTGAVDPPATPHSIASAFADDPREPLPPERQYSPALAPSNTFPNNAKPHRPPMSRMITVSSDTGTPRTSTDVYSGSNNSDETLASEYTSQASSRAPPNQGITRKASAPARVPAKRVPETLMMGWAQISGSFTLDHSLVNHGPFEEVKRKAVVGGKGGGGVVGVDTGTNNRGFFSGLGFSTISSSIGGMLGGSEMSSMKEMKGIANLESVPILSTPKSVLFVDLRLAPGESRSYTYTMKLPRGIPPTHRGRAMKVQYQLVIGTQRPATRSNPKQQMRSAEVPFRVFGGVNARGESLGHDLMSPYIILQDKAVTSTVDLGAADSRNQRPIPKPEPARAIKDGEADFQNYVQHLLSRPRRTSSTGLLSPTADLNGQDAFVSIDSLPDHAQPMTRAMVDNAIRVSTQPLSARNNSHNRNGDSEQRPMSTSPGPTTSQNQFTIARSGQPLAQLVLSRPALRLGDSLNFVLDFHPFMSTSGRPPSSTVPPVLALSLSLESSETIDPSLAIRSHSSIERATRRVWDRRVYGSTEGMGLGWCRRWAESLRVPSHATPSFHTTGVSCAWIVRAEIVLGVSRQRAPQMSNEEDETASEASSDANVERQRSGAGSEKQKALTRSQHLLELASSDERGMTLVAAQQLPCESFEVSVPIKVFGTIGATSVSEHTVGTGSEDARLLDGLEI